MESSTTLSTLYINGKCGSSVSEEVDAMEN